MTESFLWVITRMMLRLGIRRFHEVLVEAAG